MLSSERFLPFPVLLEQNDTVRKRSQTLVAPIQSASKVGSSCKPSHYTLAEIHRAVEE
jgi:hypothetical protein